MATTFRYSHGSGLPQRLRGWVFVGPMRQGTLALEETVAALGHPELRYPSILVGGTNGKGSTCAFVAAACMDAGLKVGVFLSPALARFSDHMHINDQAPSPETLERLSGDITDAGMAPLTPFEAALLLAVLWFAEESVDIGLFEVGLGGGGDATAILDPMISVITSVDLDHTRLLGDSVEAIAKVKAGVARPGRPLICAADREAAAVLRAEAQRIGAVFVPIDPPKNDDWRRFCVGGDARERRIGPVELSLIGSHQTNNANAAVAVLRQLATAGFAIDPDNIEVGLSSAQLPGRMELLSNLGPVYFDGAHNPAGAASLAHTLQTLFLKPICGIWGGYADKDLKGIICAMAPALSRLVVVRAPSPRGAAASVLSQTVSVAAPELSCETALSVEDAVSRLGDRAVGQPLIIFGSLSLYAEAAALFEAES